MKGRQTFLSIAMEVGLGVGSIDRIFEFWAKFDHKSGGRGEGCDVYEKSYI